MLERPSPQDFEARGDLVRGFWRSQLSLRPWVVGVSLLAFALVFHVALWPVRPADRLESTQLACFEFLLIGVGLVLGLGSLCSAPMDRAHRCWWLVLWMIAALVGAAMVLDRLPT